MRLVLLGPPGAGKGTQATKLAAYLGVPHVSTGDILRHNVTARSELGKKAKAYMDAGGLVAHELVIAITERPVQEAGAEEGLLLDRFPPNLAQAEGLSEVNELRGAGKLFP